MSARRFTTAGFVGLALAAVFSTAAGADTGESSTPSPEAAYEGIMEACGTSEVTIASAVSSASVSGPVADLCAGQKVVNQLSEVFTGIVADNGTADSFKMFFKASATVKPVERTYDKGVLRSFIPARTALNVSMLTLEQDLFYDGKEIAPGCVLSPSLGDTGAAGWEPESSCEVTFSNGGKVEVTVQSMALSGTSVDRKVTSVSYELSFNHTVDFPQNFTSFERPADLEEFPTVILDPQEVLLPPVTDDFVELPTVVFS